jgi:hypothetical protein
MRCGRSYYLSNVISKAWSRLVALLALSAHLIPVARGRERFAARPPLITSVQQEIEEPPHTHVAEAGSTPPSSYERSQGPASEGNAVPFRPGLQPPLWIYDEDPATRIAVQHHEHLRRQHVHG